MIEMHKQEVPFTDVVKNFILIFGSSIVTFLIASYVFETDLDKPGRAASILNSAMIGATAGFVACNTKRSKRHD